MSDTPKDRLSQFRARIDRSKKQRRKLVPDWRTNIQYRGGKPFEQASEQNRVNVPVDWSMTKSKQAQLFSQVPEVMGTPKAPQFGSAVAAFTKELNETLTRANVGAAMNEATADVINAAGFGVVSVRFESKKVSSTLPAVDPSLFPLAAEALPPIPTEETLDRRFVIERVSPGLALWPADFDKSDFDQAPWVGRTVYMTRAQAKAAFKLKDSDLDKAAGRDQADSLIADDGQNSDADEVAIDEIFYWRHLYHEDEFFYKRIHHLAFVAGLDKPVIDEPWSGQRYDEQTGEYVGACKFPLRFLTLTYLSDTAVPPSESAIIRPQVNELIQARSDMANNRRYSKPLRWADSNRADVAIIDKINAGGWQDIIPVQGNGNSIFGEVARAAYPREDFEFDRVAKADIQEATQVGPNQQGAFNMGARTAKEAEIVQAGASTRIGYERALTAAFFVGIAEVTAGLLALYGDFDLPEVSQQDAQRLVQWDRTKISHECVLSIKADSTVLLDANQQLSKIDAFLNKFAKTGYVVMEPVLRKAAALAGLDPDETIKAPQPKPEPLNLSIRNAEDLRDPLMLAALLTTGQGPNPQSIQAAQQLLLLAYGGIPPISAPAAPAQGEPSHPGAPEDMHPNMNTLPRIDNRRAED